MSSKAYFLAFLIFASLFFYGWFSNQSTFYFASLGLLYLIYICISLVIELGSRLEKVEKELKILKFQLLEKPELEKMISRGNQ